MQFSLPIAIADTKAAIIKTINESNLPICVMDEIIGGIAYEVRQKAKEELEKERNKLAEQAKEKENG